MTKRKKKAILGAMSLAVLTPALVASLGTVTFAQEAPVTKEDRQIDYYYKSTLEEQGVKWSTKQNTASGAVMLADDGRLFAWWGHPNAPKLFMGDKKFKAVDSYIDSFYEDFAAVTEDGELYLWEKSNTGFTTPKKVEGLTNVKSVSVGQVGALALTEDGKVYAWGSGTLTGQGNTTNLPTPTVVPGLDNVVQVEAGPNHSMALTESGDVYTWGSNSNGQLGYISGASQLSPKKVDSLSGIKLIGAGKYFSGAVTTDGKLYMWGKGDAGQLGTGATSGESFPKLIDTAPPFKVLELGDTSVRALSEAGESYIWGTATHEFGLSNNNESRTFLSPVKQSSMPTFSKLDFKVGSSFAVTPAGDMYVWGRNLNGELGTTKINQFSPFGTSYPEKINAVFKDSKAAVDFKMVDDKAVEISLLDAQNVTNFTIKKNGTTLHNFTTTNFVDDKVFKGVAYTYDISFTVDGKVFSKTMKYVHGEEPNFSENTPGGSDNGAGDTDGNTGGDNGNVGEPNNALSLWTFDKPTEKFITTMVPEVTVIGGKPIQGITLNKVDLGSPQTITTEYGDVKFAPDGHGNTVVSIPDGLGTDKTDTKFDLKFDGTTIMSMVIKPKPVLNFSTASK